jgi:hypothetical protein
VKIHVQLVIAAPAGVVFRFYTKLDHLRFISPRHRHEWCTKPGTVVELGSESEVRIQQHRHGLGSSRLRGGCCPVDNGSALRPWPG